jgi:CRP/FNR family transcriptional regulator
VTSDTAGRVAEELQVLLSLGRYASPSGAASTWSGARCLTCAMRAVCMPQGLTQPEIARLDSIICATRMVRQGEALYLANDPFQSIYAVRSGWFKTIVTHRDGRGQVTGFHTAGDVLGFDGLSSAQHGLSVLAIEDSNVCIIPFTLLESLCGEMNVVQQWVHRIMSDEIVRESLHMMLLGTMSAEQRVASFLLDVSARMKARGDSPVEFNLRMSRGEIGSYLGMELETVSRMFSRLQRDGLMDTHGRQIHILDSDGLSRV